MARPRWQRLTIKAVKWAVTLVVLWAVGRHVLRTWNDLRDQSQSIHFEPGWLVGAGLLYLAGLVACGRFFERILHASPTPVRLLPALRAYLVSHLGKYVPGKAMVVVVRAGMVVPFGARASTAAIATFYETLVMMASGGLIAAAGFATAPVGSGNRVTRDPYHSAALGPGRASALPACRLGRPWAGAGLCRRGRTAGLRPVGGAGQPAHSRGRARRRCLGSRAGSCAQGLSVVVVRLDLAGR